MKPGTLTGYITPADPLAVAYDSRMQAGLFVPKDAHGRRMRQVNLDQLQQWIDHLEAEADAD